MPETAKQPESALPDGRGSLRRRGAGLGYRVKGRAMSVDVTLVSMPFAEVQRPSIALGLLRAALKDTSIASEVVYANLGFAETVGLAAYQAMQAAPTDHLLGEWCFAGGLFPDSSVNDEEYLDLVLDVRCYGFPAEIEQRKEMVRWVRRQTVAYIDRLARSIVARGPHIVGCSSVFQQHCASLALLKRIRELSPDTVTLMGGANCEGEMGIETLRAFPWIDCVVSGEADGLFRDLCRLLLDKGRGVNPEELPAGALSRTHERADTPALSTNDSSAPRVVIRDLDALPTPDYDHYFSAVRSSVLSSMIQPGLLAESSRGCWWGEKSHCTFCGLNGVGMTYRSKSPGRVLEELSDLASRYGVRNIQFVDNILDMSYLKTVLSKLASSGERYSLFYETKANLKREHVRLLAEAGVRWIQPGIESLDDRLLALIGKGNSALMNLQLLKWSREFAIDASWNILSGIPGEDDHWYAEMAEWLPAMFHLQPPSGVNRVRYDRFSPYHTRAHDYGLELEPSRAYGYVYPLPNESLMRLAYSFEDRGRRRHIHRGLQNEPGQQKLQEVVREWNEMWRSPSRPVLLTRDNGDYIELTDSRPGALETQWKATRQESEICRLCDTAQKPAALLKQLRSLHGTEISWHEIEPAIERLCRARVLLQMNGRLLSLGVRSSGK